MCFACYVLHYKVVIFSRWWQELRAVMCFVFLLHFGCYSNECKPHSFVLSVFYKVPTFMTRYVLLHTAGGAWVICLAGENPGRLGIRR